MIVGDLVTINVAGTVTQAVVDSIDSENGGVRLLVEAQIWFFPKDYAVKMIRVVIK